MSKHTEKSVRAIIAKRVPKPIAEALYKSGLRIHVLQDMSFDSMQCSPFVREITANFDSYDEARTQFEAQFGDMSNTAARYGVQENAIFVREDCDEWSVVHELGHAVDSQLMPSPLPLQIKVMLVKLGVPIGVSWSDDNLVKLVADANPEIFEAMVRDAEALDALKEADEEIPVALFEELRELSRAIFPTPYCIENAHEFFAEAFAIYCNAQREIVHREWVEPSNIDCLRPIFDQLAKDGRYIEQEQVA